VHLTAQMRRRRCLASSLPPGCCKFLGSICGDGPRRFPAGVGTRSGEFSGRSTPRPRSAAFRQDGETPGMMIDSHTHAWEYWPYQPPVPDPESRGRVEQLLWEMDRCGVDMAVLVCARIEHNPRNNDYVAGCVAQYPDRLVQFADVDCSWTETYHAPGAAARLAAAAAQYGLKGYTHYLKRDTDWFESEEGLAFFRTTAELGLIASLALGPEWQPALRTLARRFPSILFLCHHMAGARAVEK